MHQVEVQTFARERGWCENDFAICVTFGKKERCYLSFDEMAEK